MPLPREKGKRSGRTTQKQQELYIQYLDNNPEFRSGKMNPNHPNMINDHWTTLTDILNSQGPPFKTTEEWKKLLRCWKNQIRFKARQVIVERNRTGGGLPKKNNLTDIEERALQSFGIVAVGGDPSVQIMGFQEDAEVEDVEANIIDENFDPNNNPDNAIDIIDDEISNIDNFNNNATVISMEIDAINITPRVCNSSIQSGQPGQRRTRPKKGSQMNELLTTLKLSTESRVVNEQRLGDAMTTMASALQTMGQADVNRASADAVMASGMQMIGQALLKISERLPL